MGNAWLFNEFNQVGVTFQSEKDASQYDSKQGTDLESKRKLVEKLGITGEDTVVELGCGTGALAIACAEKAAKVIAVDISEEMLKQCDGNAMRHQVKNIVRVHSGFLNYEHDGSLADFVVSQAAFHHLPDAWKGFALARINGFMKIGGMLYLQDAVYSFEPSEMAACVQHWIQEMPKMGFWSVEEYSKHVSEEFSTYSWIIEGLLERTGFEIVEKGLNVKTKVGASYACRKVKEIRIQTEMA